MASPRPRTYAEAREVSGTNSELAWWVFMRVSGLILIFLVFGHLWTNNIAVDAATIDYAYVASRLAQPGVIELRPELALQSQPDGGDHVAIRLHRFENAVAVTQFALRGRQRHPAAILPVPGRD